MWQALIAPCPARNSKCPARERAGYAHEGRLRGLPEPADSPPRSPAGRGVFATRLYGTPGP